MDLIVHDFGPDESPTRFGRLPGSFKGDVVVAPASFAGAMSGGKGRRFIEKKQFAVSPLREDISLDVFPFEATGYPGLSDPGFTNFTCDVMKAPPVAHQGPTCLRSHKITKRVHSVLISHPYPPYLYKPPITGREHDLSPPINDQFPVSCATGLIRPKKNERK